MRPLTATWGLAALAIAVNGIIVGQGTPIDPVFITVTALMAAACGLLLYAILPKRRAAGAPSAADVAARDETLEPARETTPEGATADDVVGLWDLAQIDHRGER